MEQRYLIFFDVVGDAACEEIVITLASRTDIVAQMSFFCKEHGIHIFLEKLSDLLQHHRIPISHLAGIAVARDIQHFTSVRIVSTIANVIGWSKGIPLAFIAAGAPLTVLWNAIAAGHRGTMLQPEYARPLAHTSHDTLR